MTIECAISTVYTRRIARKVVVKGVYQLVWRHVV